MLLGVERGKRKVRGKGKGERCVYGMGRTFLELLFEMLNYFFELGT